jgi:Tol biopolymer transport system component
MNLQSGARIGPYEIVALLGAGGMGDVYRARDTRLDRTVAVKVLKPSLAGDPSFRERFDREARTISALHHAHICTLYDVGEAAVAIAGHESGAPVSYLVMECLEGETLARRLERGPMKLADALRVATEIAGALDNAHRAGVVHRDLKPGNIMLTRSGAKLLDFGLAKTASLGAPLVTDVVGGGQSQLPTLQPITAQGTILGTFQYMAPEQLEGREAGTRSDIFAFGAVLYEMISGDRPFRGASQASLIAAILERDPPPIATSAGPTPPALDHLIRTCLAKDPDDRWQTAGDVARELKWIGTSGSDAADRVPPAARRTRRWRSAGWAAAAVATVMAAVLAGYFALGRPSPSSLVALGRTTQITFDPGLELDPTISPDGRLVAYAAGAVGHSRIYVRQLDGTRSLGLTGDVAGFQRWPKWSPDGSKIAFFSVNAGTDVRTISIIPSLGGVSKVVVEETGTFLCCPAWSPDGARIAYATGNALYVQTLDGGGLVKVAAHPFLTHSLAWSPDGRRIAYVVENLNFVFGAPDMGNIAPSSIWVIPASGGTPVQITDRVHLNMSPTWTPDGKRLLFISNRGGRRDIYQIALRDSGEPSGDAALVTAGLNALTIDLSKDGSRLAYSVYATEANIWSIPIPDHPPASLSSASQVTFGSQSVEGISVSPDGKWLAFDSSRSGNQDIYRMPVSGGELEQLTTNASDDFLPVWSPDGREIVFYSWRSGNRDVYVMAADGRSERQLTSDPGHEFYPDWSPDGRHVVFRSIQPDRNGVDTLARNTDGLSWGERKHLTSNAAGYPRWSPDGRSIAVPDFRGRSIVLLDAASGAPRLAGNKLPASGPRPNFVAWSRDSQTLFYKAIDADQQASVWAVPAAGGIPTLLVNFDDPNRPSSRIEFATDGTRLFFTVSRNEADAFVMDVRAAR